MTPAYFDAMNAIHERKVNAYADLLLTVLCGALVLFGVWSFRLPEIRFHASCENVHGGDECTIFPKVGSGR